MMYNLPIQLETVFNIKRVQKIENKKGWRKIRYKVVFLKNYID